MARKKSGAVLRQWDYWRGHIDSWRGSGLSQAAYCRRHGLAAQQLSKWKLKIKKAGDGISIKKEAQDFLEVKLASSVHEYRIEFVDGRKLVFSDGYNIQAISELISILEQSC